MFTREDHVAVSVRATASTETMTTIEIPGTKGNRPRVGDGGGIGGERTKDRGKCEGGSDREDVWAEPFNRWVLLESETLKEARKTDQLAFLELQAIKASKKIKHRHFF